MIRAAKRLLLSGRQPDIIGKDMCEVVERIIAVKCQ